MIKKEHTYRFDESLELKGYWFLPEDETNKVAGILYYSPTEGVHLELIGSFSHNENGIIAAISEFNKKKPLIYGLTANNQAVTLLNNFSYSGDININCPFAMMKYKCQIVVIGKYIGSINDTANYKAYIDIDELSQWCQPSIYNTYHGENEHGSQINAFYYEGNGTSIKDSVDIDDNFSLSLISTATFKITDTLTHVDLEQKTSLKISSHTPISLEDIKRKVFLFEQFLSLATLRSVECKRIKLEDEDLHDDINGNKIYDPIYVLYKQENLKNKDENIFLNMLFSYEQVKGDFHHIIKKWYNETKDIAPIRSHLIDSIQYKSVYSCLDFQILAYAIEGYCIRFRKEEEFTVMMEKLISHFKDIKCIQNDNINIAQLRDSRNQYSHFFKDGKKKNVIDGLELLHLTRKLRRLLICCILEFMGLDIPKIQSITNDCHHSYFKV